MSEEQKKLIDETVENLRCLDKESLMIIKSGSEMLKARDALSDREPGGSRHPEAGKESEKDGTI